MKIYFLNVGYGESIVITAQDKCIVIDGGSDNDEIYSQPGAIRLFDFLKKLGVARIDLMVLTHIHDDHAGGLPKVAETLEIGEIWCNLLFEPDIDEMIATHTDTLLGNGSNKLFLDALREYDALLHIAAERGIPVYEVSCDSFKSRSIGELEITPLGMSAEQTELTREAFERMLSLENDSEFSLLFNENNAHCNATSLALHIRQGGCGALLSADKVDGWETLSRKYDLSSNVLKLTHHGQIDGMPMTMVNAADPDCFVICADRARKYGSAHPHLIEAAKQYLTYYGRPEHVYVTGELERSSQFGCALCVELESDKGIVDISVITD